MTRRITLRINSANSATDVHLLAAAATSGGIGLANRKGNEPHHASEQSTGGLCNACKQSELDNRRHASVTVSPAKGQGTAETRARDGATITDRRCITLPTLLIAAGSQAARRTAAPALPTLLWPTRARNSGTGAEATSARNRRRRSKKKKKKKRRRRRGEKRF